MTDGSPDYERFAAHDAAFLDMEDGHAAMLLGAVLVLDARPLTTADGTFDVDRVRALVRSRLHRVPRFRRKLVGVGLVGHRAWVDDERFELKYHVRHVALPRPGSTAQLLALAGEIFSQRLDFQRPLWELWLIEGLDGGRCAVVCKMHHCLVDGIAGVGAIATLLLNPMPDGEVAAPRPWVPEPAPSALRVYADELLRRVSDAGALWQGVERAARGGTDGARVAGQARSWARHLADLFSAATETPLNGAVGPDRSLAWTSVSLEGVEDIGRRFGATVNDVVLAAVAGAVRHFLSRRRIDVDACDFRVLVPVNVRARGDELGNGTAAAIARLPIGELDAQRRLAAVRRTMAEFKATDHAAGFDTLLRLSDVLMARVAGDLFRLANRTRAHNMMVTNVPGPPIPLYVLEAPVLEAYPVAPVLARQRLSVAVLSYAGSLFWGLTADRELADDLGVFARRVRVELAALRKAADRRGTARHGRREASRAGTG